MVKKTLTVTIEGVPLDVKYSFEPAEKGNNFTPRSNMYAEILDITFDKVSFLKIISDETYNILLEKIYAYEQD